MAVFKEVMKENETQIQETHRIPKERKKNNSSGKQGMYRIPKTKTNQQEKANYLQRNDKTDRKPTPPTCHIHTFPGTKTETKKEHNNHKVLSENYCEPNNSSQLSCKEQGQNEGIFRQTKTIKATTNRVTLEELLKNMPQKGS